MLIYFKSKKKAVDYARYFNAAVDKAYRLGDDYAFDYSKEQFACGIPLVVFL